MNMAPKLTILAVLGLGLILTCGCGKKIASQATPTRTGEAKITLHVPGMTTRLKLT